MSNDSYNVQCILADTLVTNSNEVIPFVQGMTGTSLIIKQKKSLLDRVFDKIVSSIRN